MRRLRSLVLLVVTVALVLGAAACHAPRKSRGCGCGLEEHLQSRL